MIEVLDKGFVRLVDSYGDDSRIVQAARVSYGEGTKSVREDRGLIRYLMRHRHTSPFEMVDFTFHVKAPIFVARQWFRHRTHSANEMSGRYSVIKDEYYVPEVARTQDKNNKQGSNEIDADVYWEDNLNITSMMRESMASSYVSYDYLINNLSVAREMARTVLPQSMYTEFYWKQNLHNLLHLIMLREDSHAQLEIQVYAKAMRDLIEPIVPITLDAWRDYVQNSEQLSSYTTKVLGLVVECMVMGLSLDEAVRTSLHNLNDISSGEKREIKEQILRILTPTNTKLGT